MAGVLGQDVTGRRFGGRRLGGVAAFRLGAVMAVTVPCVIALAAPSVGVARAVGLAFAVAASTFCPLLVLGIWWRRLTDVGAIAGLVVGGVGVRRRDRLDARVVDRPTAGRALLMSQPAAWTRPARAGHDGRRQPAHRRTGSPPTPGGSWCACTRPRWSRSTAADAAVTPGYRVAAASLQRRLTAITQRYKAPASAADREPVAALDDGLHGAGAERGAQPGDRHLDGVLGARAYRTGSIASSACRDTTLPGLATSACSTAAAPARASRRPRRGAPRRRAAAAGARRPARSRGPSAATGARSRAA